jgi:conjugal transfer ATP-binding protein TraC
MNHEEALLAFSLHLLLRNENVPLEELENKGLMRGNLSEIGPLLNCLFIEETLSAPIVFASALPFQNSKEICALVGRETRILARNLVAMLPLYGGFQGTKTPMVQMISRGGERIHLNPKDSNGASHLAVLGGSGAGKSFSIANMTLAFMASYPKGRVFIIDKKTSYAAIALLASEEKWNGGATYFNPPQNFPNIFAGVAKSGGKIDEDRLPAIVNLLATAMTLLSPKADISATHTRVLADAVRITFEEKARQSVSEFDAETGKVISKEVSKVTLPRLSEVVSNLPAACDALQFAPHIANTLTECLSPYVGGGPYAKFFDVAAVEEVSDTAPLLTLCDLDGVSGDPVLLLLTAQAVILEILRLVKPKLDANGDVIPNPPSLLIIEEVGLLAGESPALVSFIRDAWKTMRKYDVTCVGVTNEVSDYTEKAGPKEIWNVSPNKLILTQNSSAISEMETKIQEGKNGLVPSLYHCELLRSLKMQKGEFSEAMWLGESAQGTYVYIPTGFDYWCAASNPLELSALKKLGAAILAQSADCAEPYFQAVYLLAKTFPNGVREKGEIRELNSAEISEFVSKLVPSCNERLPNA